MKKPDFSFVNECLTYGLRHQLFLADFILIGVSGGVDSMVLLDCLYQISCLFTSEQSTVWWRENKILKPDFTFPFLVVAHLNHGLREAADQDQQVVESYCKSKQIPCFSKKINLREIAQKNGLGLEESGRVERYSWFVEVAEEQVICRKNKANQPVASENFLPYFIATGHHQEDQVETFFLNLFRGSGLDGLSGMKSKQNNVIHPLLFARKPQIMDYAKVRSIFYVEDESNRNPAFTRNFYRHHIIPAVNAHLDTDVVPVLNRNIEILQQDKCFIDQMALKTYENLVFYNNNQYPSLFCSDIMEQPQAIQSRLLQLLFYKTFGQSQDFHYKHIELLRTAIKNPRESAILSLTKNKIAAFWYKRIYFCRKSDIVEHDFFHSFPELKNLLLQKRMTETKLEDVLSSFDHPKLEKDEKKAALNFEIMIKFIENMEKLVYNNQMWVGLKTETEHLVWRNPKADDWIQPYIGSGKKVLRRFLMDRKIPVFIRKDMVVLAHHNQIVWIPGLITTCSLLRSEKNNKEENSLLEYIKLEISKEEHNGSLCERSFSF